jgi:peptidoglycan-associated lipoprotein
MKASIYVLLAATVLGVVGCNRSNTLPEDTSSASDFGDNSNTTGANDGGGINVTPLTPEEAERQRLLGQLVVYFEYDQADIRPEFTAQLQAHAENLARNQNVQLRLEGHADERGSREYNIGLGERRAQAVRRVLMLQGAAQTQITTVSYGEERPAQTGTDEESWRLNRRVELVYR